MPRAATAPSLRFGVTESPSTRLRFARSQRLTHAREFAAAYGAKCSINRGPLRIHAVLNASEPVVTRLGLSIGKRVGGAVVRNRLKRLLRESFRLRQRDLPAGVDLVIVAHPHESLTLAAYEELLVDAAWSLARRLHDRQKHAPKPYASTPTTPKPAPES